MGIQRVLLGNGFRSCNINANNFTGLHQVNISNGMPIISEKKLSYKARKALPKTSFVYPGERKYPIQDITHARNALSRVAAHGTEAEKSRVKSAVYKRYPSLKKD